MVLAAAIAIIIFAYRRVDKPLNRGLKAILIILRSASVCLLVICLLKPTLIDREKIDRKASLLVLVDDSQSMSVTDPGDGTSRIDAVKRAFAPGDNSLTATLRDNFNTQYYQFNSDCSLVDNLSLSAEGTLTDLSRAISKAADEWRGQLTAGIVLVTDGGSNSGGSPLESAKQAGMPVYAVGVGSIESPRDIQIIRVEASPIAYVDHVLPIRAIIKSSGYDGRKVRVSLVRGEGQTQGSPLLDSVSITLDSQTNEQVVDLQLKPQQEGIFNFSIAVPVASEEFSERNNEYPFLVKVVREKLRILYVDGRPRWEHTFLRRILQRDPNMESTFLVMKGKQIEAAQPESFPATKNEIFSYDVLILGDIKPEFFSNEQLAAIRDFVEDKGGSVIFLAGKHSLGQGGFGASILSDMLPIKIGPDGARQVENHFSPALTQDGVRHPATNFGGDEAENMAIWRDLPAMTQFYEGIGIKMGTTVLAEHKRDQKDSQSSPIIMFQRYDKGVVMLIASDSLWRWAFGAYPFGGDDSYYRKFWSKTIRWLASMNTEADLVNVETDKGSYHRDEKVHVTAYTYDENYAPISDAQLEAHVQTRDSQGGALDLEFIADANGRYSAEFTPTMDGHYEIVIEAQHANRLLGKGSSEFIVQTTGLEFQDTRLKEALLKDMSDISGGSYRHLRDISDLPAAIEKVNDSYTFTRERSLWDNGIMLIIAVALLGIEWFIRKRKGLV